MLCSYLSSELWFLTYCENGELVVIGVTTHKLADCDTCHAGQCLRTALSMIDRFFLPPIKLVQTSILLYKRDEMRLHLVLYFSLALLDRGTMLLENLLV